jgi:hypothetical protein
MFRKRLSILVLLLLISACSSSARNRQAEHWVIFSEEQAQESGIGNGFAEDETLVYWTPSEEDVQALESELGTYLQEHADSFSGLGTPIWERLDEYNRQYIGITLDGKQIIYANYFCDSVDLDWRKEFVFVMDGGDCFFQFKYDVDSATLFDLQVNGNA